MTSDIERRQAERLALLSALYDALDGDPRGIVDFRVLANALHMDNASAMRACEYLVAEDLADWAALGGIICITHLGVREVEATRLHRDEPTAHFSAPAITYSFQIGSMHNSAVQAGSPGAVQQLGAPSGDALEQIKSAIDRLAAEIDQLQLSAPQRDDLHADAATVQAQLRKPRPTMAIVTEALKSIREGLQAAGATGEVVQQVFEVLRSLAI